MTKTNQKIEQEINNIENANFVILTLIRELTTLAQTKDEKQAENYKQQITQLQKDLKHLNNPQVFAKVKNIYIPYLKKLTETNNDRLRPDSFSRRA